MVASRPPTEPRERAPKASVISAPLDTLQVGDMYLVSDIRALDSQLAPSYHTNSATYIRLGGRQRPDVLLTSKGTVINIFGLMALFPH